MIILKPTLAEQKIVETLSNDRDVKIDTLKMHVLRTSSRVCFSVEHGDYNGTDLFGAAIGRATDKEAYGFIWHAFSRNNSGKFRIKSLNEEGIAEFDENTIIPKNRITKDTSWIKFPMGALYILKKQGYKIKYGINGVLLGKIPSGGLSRSASLSLNLIHSILEANSIIEQNKLKIIDMAKELENEYIKSPCGKLDMAMIEFGRKGNAVLYSQKKNTFSYVSMPKNQDVELIVLDTGTKRQGLQGTDYEIRKKECEEIVKLYGKKYNFNDLSEVSEEMYNILTSKLSQENLKLRLKYIFESKSRLPEFIEAWKNGNFERAGEILNLDGFGLRDDYDLSSYELETMNNFARADDFVYGARLSGGGRVGACIALRKRTGFDEFKIAIEKNYRKSFPNLLPDIKSYDFSDGVVKLKR